MGTFAEYIGTMDIPENRRAEYARQMLRLLHAGGMMSVDEVGLFGHRIRLPYPPELDETGRAWGCYNYFAVAPRGVGQDHRHDPAGEVSASYGGCHRRCGELRFPGYVL